MSPEITEEQEGSTYELYVLTDLICNVSLLQSGLRLWFCISGGCRWLQVSSSAASSFAMVWIPRGAWVCRL